MQIKKKKTFLTLLFSNSLMLLLVLTVSAFTFVGVTELYKDEIKKHYVAEAKMDKIVIDSALKNIDEMLYKLSSDETVKKISNFSAPITNEQYLIAAKVYNDNPE